VDAQYAALSAKTVDWQALRGEFLARLDLVNSNGEGIWTIVEMVAALGDGHTYAVNDAACGAARPYVAGVSDLGACLEEDALGLFVYSASPDNPTGLKVGDRLWGINGRSAEDALRDRIAQPRCTISASSPAMARRAALHSLLYRGRDNERLRVYRPNGGEFEALELVAQRTTALTNCDGRIVPPGVSSYGAGVVGGALEGGVFYLWFPFFGSFSAGGEFVDEPILQALRAAFEDAQQAPGVVLDLRTNGGGYVTVYLALASWLYPDVTELFTCRNKTGPGPNDFGQPYPLTSFPDPTLTYEGPVAVLVNARSFSAADFTSGFLSWTGRAASFGEPSGGGFGSGGGGAIGNGWSVGVNNTECADLEGNLLEGNPPPVDFSVTHSATKAIAGKDAVIDAAVEWILAPGNR
jgi:C-terminal processing protease CtpA/Prc